MSDPMNEGYHQKSGHLQMSHTTPRLAGPNGSDGKTLLLPSPTVRSPRSRG